MSSPAPAFTLLDQDNQAHSLSDYVGKKVLLYFYPKDDTPGCTTEACTFQDHLNELKKHNLQVLGVSADSVASHKKFAEKFHLNFPLLSDPDKKMIEAYGVWQKKSMFGRKYMGIARESFLIDETGSIIKHYTKVKPAEHVQEVLTDIKSM